VVPDNLRLLANALMLAVRRGTASLFVCVCVRTAEYRLCFPIVTARSKRGSFERAHPERHVLHKHREKQEEPKGA